MHACSVGQNIMVEAAAAALTNVTASLTKFLLVGKSDSSVGISSLLQLSRSGLHPQQTKRVHSIWESGVSAS